MSLERQLDVAYTGTDIADAQIMGPVEAVADLNAVPARGEMGEVESAEAL